MMKLINVILFINVFVTIECTVLHKYPVIQSTVEEDLEEGYGEPLFLTPYLERGDIQGAQQAAFVKPLYGNIVSYSGFFTVNKQYNSNIFFWFFPAEIDSNIAPVAVWLQGGPGGSSMFGLITEHGPFYVGKNNEILPRQYYWTKKLNVIYIDNPVGTGFSFTDNDKGYATNQIDIGENLYKTIQQFFQLFPKYIKNDFYITGESYAGKYVPAFAHKIHVSNQNLIEPNKWINLKGISIGNGACDPLNMLKYDDYLYQLGLIDMNTKLKIASIQDEMKSLIKQNNYKEIVNLLKKFANLFHSSTGFTYIYNYLHDKMNDTYGNIGNFFDNPCLRKNVHVGNLDFSDGNIVKLYLIKDFMKSVKPWIENLLEHYKVLLYNGQLDIILAYPLTENFIQSMNWSGAEEYKKAERKLWYVDNELAGYTKTVGKFTEVLVRNAGHMVPSDQPKWAFNLISSFTNTL